MPAFANANRVQTKAATDSGRRFRKPDRGSLEGEIYAGANHAKVVLRPVHKIPAEITDPANVWGHANFHATANLADCLRLGTGLLSTNDSVVQDNVRSFAAAKDSAAPTKDVGREARAANRVA